MKKFFLIFAIFLLLFPVAFAETFLKCEKKGNTWECKYEGTKCEITQSEIKCEILETPYGSERKKISIFGTEYEPFDEGRIYLQLLDSQQPVNNATCLIDLYKPNKSVWFNDAMMTYLSGSDGLYYFDVIIPEDTGVYMLTVRCFYIVDYTKDYADNFTLEVGSETGTYLYTYYEDSVYHSIKEKPVAGKFTLRFYYDFYNISIPANYTGMGIKWIGRWDDTQEDVYMQLWNFCNSSWVRLPNSINYYTPMVTQFLDKDSWNVSCYVFNQAVRLGFVDSNPSENVYAGTLSTDFLDVEMNYLTFGAMEQIRGGGELHVTNRAELTWEEFFARGTPIEEKPCPTYLFIIFSILIAIIFLIIGRYS